MVTILPGLDLKTDKKDKETIYYNLTLDKDMSFKGKLSYARYDYAGYDFRKAYHKFNSENEFIDDFKKEKPGLVILKADLAKY